LHKQFAIAKSTPEKNNNPVLDRCDWQTDWWAGLWVV